MDLTYKAETNAAVSMKSGLEDRNNVRLGDYWAGHELVSMKSGLEDRNNREWCPTGRPSPERLNEVRPGRPEQ